MKIVLIYNPRTQSTEFWLLQNNLPSIRMCNIDDFFLRRKPFDLNRFVKMGRRQVDGSVIIEMSLHFIDTYNELTE